MAQGGLEQYIIILPRARSHIRDTEVRVTSVHLRRRKYMASFRGGLLKRVASSDSSKRRYPPMIHPSQKQQQERGKLFFDRDYHIHLGGAIPSSLISEWINDGHLCLDDEIQDLVAPGNSNTHPTITVRQALIKYRGVTNLNTECQPNCDANADPNKIGSKMHNRIGDKYAFLSLYDEPPYTSLPTFLTLYRAYSNRNLLHQYASIIATLSELDGGLVNPFADVRVSLPPPNDGFAKAPNKNTAKKNKATNTGNGNDTEKNESISEKESPSDYAIRALNEMVYFHSCLLRTQKLMITFPRQTFNANKNWDYYCAFLELLSSSMTSSPLPTSFKLPWSETQQPAFDFAGQPLPIAQTLPLLSKLRKTFPSSLICYHHGEVCPYIPFSDRVNDAMKLLPYVNRVGHGLCLGLAMLGINPDFDGDSYRSLNAIPSDESYGKYIREENKQIAYECLREMALSNIGIEVSPTCNISLGGAHNGYVLRQYVKEFLNMGVNVFVGTDDPGFLKTTLKKEISILSVDDMGRS